MVLLILADYCEEKGFINKAKRLRTHKPLVVFGWHSQYNEYLEEEFTYGYDHGNACCFNYGSGIGYIRGNGSGY